MRTGPFASAWRKWDRGEHYRDMLEADFLRLSEFQGDSTGLNLQQDKSRDRTDGNQRIIHIAVLVDSSIPQLSPDFPLILGDAIHNYRSALDHATWELARRFGAKLTVIERRNVQFPMHNGATGFADWQERRTPGVPDKPHRAFLKRYQPYRRGNGPSAIRWLRRLSDRDKHREVIPAVIAPQGILLKASCPDPEIILQNFTQLLTGPSAIKPGTPVAELQLAAPIPVEPRQAQVRVDAEFTLMPLLSRRVHPGVALANISLVTQGIIEGIEALG